MNILPRIVRRSRKMAKQYTIMTFTKRRMIYCINNCKRITRRGIYNRCIRSFASKPHQPLKCGISTTTILGVYGVYLTYIYGTQYMRESSRKFNSRSTSDDVMKNVNLTGKFAIITGCNSGLGKETVRAMVSKGCKIIMACRNIEKAETAKTEIIETFDDTLKDAISKSLIVMKLDLSSLQSVYDFAKEFAQTGLKCDYLINNAGIMALPNYVTTTDDIERQFGVNHLGHWYLTKLLLDPVLIPNKTRVISLSSIGHQWGPSYDELETILDKSMHEKEFMGSQKDNYAPMRNYGISKASNILFARQLNTLYKDQGIVSVSCHPGVIMETRIGDNIRLSLSGLVEMIQLIPLYLLTPFGIVENKNVKQGTATPLRCVTMSNDEIIGGEFYYNCIPASVENRYFDNVKVKNDEDILAKKLWILSETIVKNKGFKLEL